MKTVIVVLWFTSGFSTVSTDAFHVFEGVDAMERCERTRQHMIDKPDFIGETFWDIQKMPSGRYTDETLTCELVE